jgi:CRISPR-associated protein (TIGR02584 family)
MSKTILLATVGQRPAAITMALDNLYPRYAYEQIVLLHTDPNHHGIAESLRGLIAELQTYDNLHIQQVEMTRTDGTSMTDIDTHPNAEGYFHSLLDTFRTFRQQGYSVHVLISGGRKAMSAYAVVAASYMLSYNDRLWTSMVSPDLMKPDLWHAPPGKTNEVTVLSLPFKASQLTNQQLDDVELQTLVWGETYDLRERFIAGLTPTEARITQMILDHPYDTDAQIADHLAMAPKTVGNHLTRIYGKLEGYFGHVTDSNKRFFLRDVLNGRF